MALHQASRIMAVSSGGQVVVSDTAVREDAARRHGHRCGDGAVDRIRTRGSQTSAGDTEWTEVDFVAQWHALEVARAVSKPRDGDGLRPSGKCRLKGTRNPLPDDSQEDYGPSGRGLRPFHLGVVG
jgi:hypothetical protein